MGEYDHTAGKFFDDACEMQPERTALYYLGNGFTYARLRNYVDRFATALSALGVKENDKVLLYCYNSPQWLIAYFATMRIGAICVTISPIYTPFEIEYLANDSGAETIVCQDSNFGYVAEIRPKTSLKRIIVTGYLDLLPVHKKLFAHLFDVVPKGAVERFEGVYFFKSLLKKYPPEPPQVTIKPREHLAFIHYTGGTTGFPKGCPYFHSGAYSSFLDIAEVAGPHLSSEEDLLIFPAPLFHGFGQLMLNALAFAHSIPTVLMPIPHIDAILDAIQRYRGTMLIGVPAFYRMILENDRVDIYDLSSLKYCWSGADVLPQEVNNRWKKKTRTSLYQIYGTSETGIGAMSTLDKEPIPGSIGQPVRSRGFRIVKPDTVEPVSPGEVGEVLIHSDTMPNYYWNKPEETAKAYQSWEGKMWYRTGDSCRLGEDGQIYFVDRSVDTIKYKGYRVAASEIESVLQDHPVVVSACVVGLPDERVGERIKAMVVIKEGAKGVSAHDLTAWCRERLAPYKIPKYIEFRDMLPKSKVGKLLRREIRDEEFRKRDKEETSKVGA